MSMEPAVDTVVEVFMERRSEYLPRLRRIAAVMAGCACSSVSENANSVLVEACDASVGGSERAQIRIILHEGELKAEITRPGASAKVDFCLSRQ